MSSRANEYELPINDLNDKEDEDNSWIDDEDDDEDEYDEDNSWIDD